MKHEKLDLEFTDPDIGQTSIRDYFKKLLINLLQEGESFSGKRPFGNSGWESFAAGPLIKAGYLKGELDEDGYPYNYSNDEYDTILLNLVELL